MIFSALGQYTYTSSKITWQLSYMIGNSFFPSNRREFFPEEELVFYHSITNSDNLLNAS